VKDRTVYILTIYDCLNQIEDYTKGYSLKEFLADRKTQDAVIRNIEIIGQAGVAAI
jgi:uncharacterized protein with HEPN domain